MTEEKKRRLITALKVGAVVLLVFLIAILTYQTVKKISYNKRIKNLEAEITRYERLIEEGKSEYELRELKEWIEAEARELGYVFKNADEELG